MQYTKPTKFYTNLKQNLTLIQLAGGVGLLVTITISLSIANVITEVLRDGLEKRSNS